jgi:hypothetical protein
MRHVITTTVYYCMNGRTVAHVSSVPFVEQAWRDEGRYARHNVLCSMVFPHCQHGYPHCRWNTLSQAHAAPIRCHTASAGDHNNASLRNMSIARSNSDAAARLVAIATLPRHYCNSTPRCGTGSTVAMILGALDMVMIPATHWSLLSPPMHQPPQRMLSSYKLLLPPAVHRTILKSNDTHQGSLAPSSHSNPPGCLVSCAKWSLPVASAASAIHAASVGVLLQDTTTTSLFSRHNEYCWRSNAVAVRRA